MTSENRDGPDAGQHGRTGGTGQSNGGAYPNPHSGKGGGQGGDTSDTTGGQTGQGYHGGGQLGDQNHSDTDHHGASRQSGPSHGPTTDTDNRDA